MLLTLCNEKPAGGKGGEGGVKLKGESYIHLSISCLSESSGPRLFCCWSFLKKKTVIDGVEQLESL